MTPSSPRTLAPIAKPATPRKVTSNTSDVFVNYLFDCSFVHSKFVIYSTMHFTQLLLCSCIYFISVFFYCLCCIIFVDSYG